jgi:hypothetical protein
MKNDLPALLFAMFGRILGDQAREWMAWIPNVLIRWAARRFQPEQKNRIQEEWLAHANDLPGNLAKVWHALGCVATAVRVTNALGEALAIALLPAIVPSLAAFFVFGLSRIWVFGPSVYRKDLSEPRRARRLQNAAGRLVVLGLDNRDFAVADFPLLFARPLPRILSFLLEGTVLQRAFGLYFRVLNRLAGPPDEFVPPIECVPTSVRKALLQYFEKRRNKVAGN